MKMVSLHLRYGDDGEVGTVPELFERAREALRLLGVSEKPSLRLRYIEAKEGGIRHVRSVVVKNEN